jgi:FMN phosphatase YigB (HAD superfamily)
VLAVFDIDGVVADVRHRVHHIEGRHRSWDGFFEAADEDPLLTGRPEWLREVTTAWLDGHGLPAAEVHLRPYGDYRPAPRYKLDVLTRLAPRGVAAFVDDDDLVVKAALDAGFPAVLADWVPRGRTLRRAQDSDGRT